MRLYVVRHGESEANEKGLWAGWHDVSLTEKGMKDAEGVKRILSRYHMDKVYSSSLKRAKETARLAVPYLEAEVWHELDEQKLGVLEMMGKEERDRQYGSILPSCMDSRDFSFFGGEDRDTVQKRVWSFMKEMESEDPDVFIAVFTHFWPMIEMVSYVLGRNVGADYVFPKNGSVILFDFRYGKWRIEDPFSF